MSKDGKRKQRYKKIDKKKQKEEKEKQNVGKRLCEGLE
jgi:hypothetical protein